MELKRRRKIELAVNLTPLIDCVFLLLIFFLLTSFLIAPESVKIELPSSSFTEKLQPSELIISLTAEGKIYLGTQELGLKGLSQFVQERIREGGFKRIILKADEKVNLGNLFLVMDELKKAGAEAVDIQTIPKEDGK